jgi:hypothetical protein
MHAAFKLSLAAAAATLAFAAPASAQVNFYTQGYFTSIYAGCNGVAPLLGAPQGALCTLGGLTLNYAAAPVNPGSIASGSIVSFGQFALFGTGNTTLVANDVQFTLLVQQTSPTPGTGTFTGYLTGTVTTNSGGGDASSLVWRPNSFVDITPATYQMIFDNVGPGAGDGLGIPVNQTRGINALVTTVPEPSTYALMAAGLAGIFLAGRRRRQTV